MSSRRQPTLLLLLLLHILQCHADSSGRPALLLRRTTTNKKPSVRGVLRESGHAIVRRGEYLQATKPASSTWRERLTAWAREHVDAPWFPWILAAIGFLDPFTMCGFLLTPLLSIALLTADLPKACILCGAASGGCLIGGVLFTALLGRLRFLTASLEGSHALSVARELLLKHGVLAGVLNTLLPLPTVPLMVAAQLSGARVPTILAMMALGRLCRYVAVYVAIVGSREVYRRSTVSWQDQALGGSAVASARM